MANQRVSDTAVGAATCRLIEQYEPEQTRLFDDPLVKDLLATPIRTLMQLKSMRKLAIQQMDAITPGIYGVQISRARFIDDAVQEALAGGIQQVVILGAGLDTRAYRLTGIAQARVFEVDLPFVQAQKKQRVQKHFGQLPPHVTFIPIDFDTQSLEDALAGTTFDSASPTIFVWEGVTQYLTEEAVRRTLTFIGASTPGSRLIFTYVLQSLIQRSSDIPGADKMMDMMAKRGSPWLFGLDPSEVAAYLSPFHLHLNTDIGSTEYQTRYFQPMGRQLVVSEVERIALATVGQS